MTQIKKGQNQNTKNIKGFELARYILGKDNRQSSRLKNYTMHCNICLISVEHIDVEIRRTIFKRKAQLMSGNPPV